MMLADHASDMPSGTAAIERPPLSAADRRPKIIDEWDDVQCASIAPLPARWCLMCRGSWRFLLPDRSGLWRASVTSKPRIARAAVVDGDAMHQVRTSRASGRRRIAGLWIKRLGHRSLQHRRNLRLLLTGAEIPQAKMRGAEHGSTNSIRLPSSSATRCRFAGHLPQSRGDACGLLRDLTPRHPPGAADQRLASGFLAAASDHIARCFGAVRKTPGTTRSRSAPQAAWREWNRATVHCRCL